MTKGQWGTRSKLFRRANESMMKSYWYAYRDRKVRRREYRRLWITRINAGSRQHGMSYSKFIRGLKLAGIEVNRKELARIAYEDAAGFDRFVELAKQV